MADNLNLFTEESSTSHLGNRSTREAPLADRLRPNRWEDYQGLEEIDKNLLGQLQAGRGRAPSLILWGPPGTGKTTLARLIGNTYDCHFIQLSAVLGGVKEVREAIAAARKSPLQTILFIDEIHRFNKAQQDAFLPHVESGVVVLIGATTENPSFYLNNALLSRVRVIPLKSLEVANLEHILQRAISELKIEMDEDSKELLKIFSGGDARRMLNTIEAYKEAQHQDEIKVDKHTLEEFLRTSNSNYYDRDGEEHYNMISAFIKSMRGSNADGALYWAFRMIEGGEDPRYILRRMMIFASEDVGNADPRALQLSVSTMEAYERLGLPEGKIPIAQCITYLASAPKSNRSYQAMNEVLAAIAEHPKISVPLHLRNAPTKLMKNLDYGKGYQYPHSYEHGYVDDVQYLPDQIADKEFYHLSDRGYEGKMKAWLESLKR